MELGQFLRLAAGPSVVHMLAKMQLKLDQQEGGHACWQGNRIWNFVAFEHDSDSAEGSIDIIGAEAWTGFGIAFPELWIRVLATRGFMICMNFC
jgi:hypothetical protein